MFDIHGFARIRQNRPNHEACAKQYEIIMESLEKGELKADDISYRDLMFATGAADPLRPEEGVKAIAFHQKNLLDAGVTEAAIFSESNPGVNSNTFALITGELISSKMIEGYNTGSDGFIVDQLVDNMPNQRIPEQRIAGLKALTGAEDVHEGEVYPETTMGEKYVTTKEQKRGRILSLNEETLLFDRTGVINRNARELGEWVRQDKERLELRQVLDADYSAGVTGVYRPSGVITELYKSDASNQNFIGSGGLSGYDTNTALTDWNDLDLVRKFRATQVKDDRLDGDARPIVGLNTGNILLVPESVATTAAYIVDSAGGEERTNSGNRITNVSNPVRGMVGRVLHSPFIDEINAGDWYYGDFKKQYVRTEIWPVQTRFQGEDSESSFDRDVPLRIKLRYFSGISALDTKWVTKVKSGV